LRRMSLAAGTFLQIFFTNMIYLPVTALGAWLTWTTPDWPTLGLLALTGVVGGLAQMSSFEAIRRSPASVLAPFEYTALIWAFVLGFVVWGDVPRVQVFVGAGMILASGLLVLLALRGRPG
jgi:drug/metabolite transporter (DMT)-like permease